MPAGTTELPLTNVVIKIDGTALPLTVYQQLDIMEVDDSLYLPSMATLRFNDPLGALVDADTLKIGGAILISIGKPAAQIFDGEITSIEPDFNTSSFNSVTVRAYDRAHRMMRGTVTKTYANVSDSDLVTQLAGNSGLQADAESTSVVHEYVLQSNESDYAFLQRRAARIGKVLRVVGTKLTLKTAGGSGAPSGPDLTLGVNLKEFRPRESAVQQVTAVSVRNWDPKQKQAIVANGSSATATNSVGASISGLPSVFSGSPKLGAIDVPVDQTSGAEAYANALLARAVNGAVQAEGVAFGNPALAAGSNVEVKSVGTKFGGKYLITRAIHRYTTEDGYYTAIESTNGTGETAASLVGAEDQPFELPPQQGLLIGVVTNNKDEDGMGRVKVKFPAFIQDAGADIESTWARIASPFAGASRGMQYLPEVNDEVLVGFELGDLARPYIIGSLWNGRDAPPLAAGEAVGSDGKVKRRVIKTTSGHLFAFDDTAGAEKIELIDKTGKNKILIDSSANTINIECGGDITVKATGKVNVQATSDVSVKGMQVSVKADGNLNVEAAGQLSLKASAGAKIDGGAMVEIKGGVVKIN
jgi:Rhs element Vgr protein